MSYILRVLKFSFQDFYRNIWLSLVTISILILTFISINVLVIFDSMTKTAVNIIENKVDISVNFKSSVSSEEVSDMKEYIKGLSEVSAVEYVSKQEALQKFRKTHQNDEVVLEVIEELSENPLGAIIKIKARNLESYPAILEAIDKPEYNKLVASKNYHDKQQMINKVSGWTGAAERVVLVFILFFMAVSALIVFNTIRVAIYTHREEIGIEKLVGATNWFVRLPFIIESVIYAIIACLITIAVIYPLLDVIQPYLASFFGAGQFNIATYFTNNFILIFGLQLLAVSVINVIASFIATRKYLRV